MIPIQEERPLDVFNIPRDLINDLEDSRSDINNLNKTKTMGKKYFEEIPVTSGDMPDQSGKYVVRTISSSKIPGSKGTNRFEARLTITEDEKGEKKYTWDIHNQIVTHWFKELDSNETEES